MPEDSDLELVERFRRHGEQQAFERLVARHQGWIRRVCARLLRSDDLAKDATQEVFARALERLDTFRGDSLPGWLRAIAVNCCLTIIEREKRWSPLEDAGSVQSPAVGPDLQVLRSERREQTARLIARLPEKQKIVFCLKYIDECSYADIERLTGFSNREVKSFLQNARRNFENWWREAEKGPAWRKKI